VSPPLYYQPNAHSIWYFITQNFDSESISESGSDECSGRSGYDDDLPGRSRSRKKSQKNQNVNQDQVSEIVDLYTNLRDDSKRVNNQLAQLENLLESVFDVKIGIGQGKTTVVYHVTYITLIYTRNTS